MARFTFFLGKGGVGKTTMSSAYALHRADRHRRSKLLLLSTDPAHSLADVLQTKLSDRPKALRSNLDARQLDADRQIRRFLSTERRDILALLNKGTLFAGDELAPLLDTSLPGMSEVAALLALEQLLDSGYDEIVIDTAPMGHAIRLFQMPEHFARFLDVLEAAAERDLVLARHFGGHVRREPALQRWSRLVERVEAALSAADSELMLVTTPEPFSMNEAVRSAPSFTVGERQQPISAIVLNRIVAPQKNCARCNREAAQSQVARRFLRAQFPRARLFTAEDPGCLILGLDRLLAFGKHVFAAKKLPRSVLIKPAKQQHFELERASWPALGTPLTLTLGKGGVGKTTISAALAFHQRQAAKGEPVAICSIDPAPSLDDVFATGVDDRPRPVLRDPKLLAVEFDAMAEFAAWAGNLRRQLTGAMTTEQRGIHVDLSPDRKFLLALLDVVPPGVDEIFAIFRILELLRSGGRVVIDMAPTGHALEVLRTPARLLAWTRALMSTLAAHRGLPLARDAAVEVATLSQNVRELASVLRDRRRCHIALVSLPEPLPDYETERLLAALAELKMPVEAMFVNRVLPDGNEECPHCRLRGRWQAASLAKLRTRVKHMTIYVAREFDTPVAGAKALRAFTRELWRLKR